MDFDLISIDIITLLLYIPIIVTILNLFRYVIGFKTIGFYPVIALSFAYILTGGKIGLIITFLVILISYISYRILAKARLHYISRISINYTLLSIILLLVIYFSINSEFISSYVNFNNINLGGLLLIITVSDALVKNFIQKDTFSNIRGIAETIIIALVGWIFLKIPNITNIILQNAWIIPLLFIVNIIIGQNTLLRILEFNKFRYILKKKKEEEE